MPPDESRLRIAQLGSDLQHQFLFGELIRFEQHNTCGIAAEKLIGEGIEDIVCHCFSLILFLY